MESKPAAVRRGQAEAVRAHASKGIILVVRRSRLSQPTHDGSLEVLSQSRHLERHGMSDLPYEIIDRGGWATEGREREFLDSLTARMEGGTLGLIVVSSVSRLTRNVVNGERLIKAARENEVLYMVNGEILDPHEPAWLVTINDKVRQLEHAMRRASCRRHTHGMRHPGRG